MNWKQDKSTGHWCAEEEGYKIRLQRSKWGNTKISAWEIFINGTSHGKELNLGCAKAEAKRELHILIKRVGF